jgi:quercetin dioxygenase-like cupin family protein
MSITHAQSGEVIVLPLGPGLATSRTTTLLKTDHLELIRLVLNEGRSIPIHRAPGEITVQCLEGRVAFTVGSSTQELLPGTIIYLSAGEPHAVTAIEPSALLLTLTTPHGRKPATP